MTASDGATLDRHAALDVLRGVALLGILPMNVQAMAMPFSAYTNPASYGDLTGVNLIVWCVTHVLTDQKMMAIFSMLFGAGVCLFTERAEAKTGRSAALHYRRTLALLAIGLAHAWLLFHGDILVHYAICALWVYWLRKARVRTLVVVAALLLCVPALIMVLATLAVPGMPPEVAAQINAGWAPPADAQEANIRGMTGTMLEQLATRAPMTKTLETLVFGTFFFWRASGLMVLGMALYKTGFLLARAAPSTYARLACIALPIGLALSAVGIAMNFDRAWAFGYSMFAGTLPNYVGSIAAALGFIALVMLAVQRSSLHALQERLAAVGRMAFTNYLAHSVVAVALFNFGGLYGAVERWQQLLFVACVLAAQLAWSKPWLARVHFGPVEWFWRALTYGRVPPWYRSTT